jgi:hypothetical protein
MAGAIDVNSQSKSVQRQGGAAAPPGTMAAQQRGPAGGEMGRLIIGKGHQTGHFVRLVRCPSRGNAIAPVIVEHNSNAN